jgi:RNA polymerase sigma factor (sigma-70 family)
MSLPQTLAREVFENNLTLIHEVIRHVARRHRLRTEEREDLVSSVLLRLIEDDYKIFRSFRGKSSLRTYLVTVVHRLFLDSRIQAWGKWRPSEKVRRFGKRAEELDKLLSRDGYSLEVALELLQKRHRKTSRDEWLALASRIPRRRARPLYESEECLDHVAMEGEVDERIVTRDRTTALRKMRVSLTRALQELPAQDRLILRMRYENGFTIRKIAETLNVEDSSLYRRFAGCLKRLRALLERQGVSRQEVVALLGEPGTEIGLQGTLSPDLSAL